MEYNCDAYVRKPYPKVIVEAKNNYYADILLELYAGRASEMTAISTYGYQTIELKDRDPRAATMIQCISITEMKHFEILGELIKLLGIDPKLLAPMKNGGRRARYYWWSGDYVNYSKEYPAIIDMNIAGEKQAIQDYKRAISMISDKNVVENLERIILDEEKHIEIFESMKRSSEMN